MELKHSLIGKTRILLLICGLAGTLIGVVGCGKTEDKKSLFILSRLWSKPSEQLYIKREIFAPFEKEKGIHIRMDVLEDTQNLQRVEIQQKSKNYIADIIISHSGNMSQWIDYGYVESLNPIMKDWKNREIIPAFNKNTSKDGKTYFIPIAADVYLLMANKKAMPYLPKGVDINDITWVQLVQWAKNIRKQTGVGRFIVSGVQDQSFIYQIGACALSYGSSFPSINSDGAIKAWELFSDMAKSYTPSVINVSDCSLPMKRGEGWLTVMINAAVADVFASNQTKYVVAAMPKGPKGRGMIAAANGIGIITHSKHPELAREFVEYITRPEVLAKIARGPGGFIPPMEETMKYLNDAGQDEVTRQAIAQLNKDSIISGVPGDKYQSWSAVKLVFDNIFKLYILKDKEITKAVLDKGEEQLNELKIK